MIVKFVIDSVINWRKNNLPIPVTAFHDMSSLADDSHREVKPFLTTVNLIHAIYMFITIELRFLITAE